MHLDSRIFLLLSNIMNEPLRSRSLRRVSESRSIQLFCFSFSSGSLGQTLTESAFSC